MVIFTSHSVTNGLNFCEIFPSHNHQQNKLQSSRLCWLKEVPRMHHNHDTGFFSPDVGLSACSSSPEMCLPNRWQKQPQGPGNTWKVDRLTAGDGVNPKHSALFGLAKRNEPFLWRVFFLLMESGRFQFATKRLVPHWETCFFSGWEERLDPQTVCFPVNWKANSHKEALVSYLDHPFQVETFRFIIQFSRHVPPLFDRFFCCEHSLFSKGKERASRRTRVQKVGQKATYQFDSEPDVTSENLTGDKKDKPKQEGQDLLYLF